MSSALWSDADTERARAHWQEYQSLHDVSDHVGQAVGIDPTTGRVWFGDSAEDIVRQLDVQGVTTPLYFLRVGFDYYQRKGGRR